MSARPPAAFGQPIEHPGRWAIKPTKPLLLHMMHDHAAQEFAGELPGRTCAGHLEPERAELIRVQGAKANELAGKIVGRLGGRRLRACAAHGLRCPVAAEMRRPAHAAAAVEMVFA